ncbi:hypothetical protein D9611_011476 [Ephemerocybe angulata]|uniref:Uncharacterized protein n=1 Tax=Ephemerocybe angulata TaxID=980116 RepID=A0A8H5CFK5_9AGAR|nr:hypothetical protein D9611_011476 [Tulosesus angulatus]
MPFTSNPFASIDTPPNLGISIALLAIVAFTFMSTLYHGKRTQDGAKQPQGYILHASVTHGRYLPVESKHAFTYPALYKLVSLGALESGSLNVGFRSSWAWAFGYGNPKRRITSINPGGYLSSGREAEKGTILDRLDEILRRELRESLSSTGFEEGLEPLVDDAWMLTMPSFLGWEGINPLTVYFVYSRRGVQPEDEALFRYVVLEIHNTFGESHVYVLKVGEGEDAVESKDRGYDHQWTFPRQFHVSPFNDRSGYYTISIRRPTHPPSSPNAISSLDSIEFPKPTVRVQLYTDSATGDRNANPNARGDLKLTAILRPTAAYPLSGPGVILKSLIKMPLDLFLTMPRILYQAWILHYGGPKLDVYLRPEMRWPGLWQGSIRTGGGGVKWLGEGLSEKYAKWRVERFLQRRVNETGISVTLVAANPAVGTRLFLPEGGQVNKHQKNEEDGWTWIDDRSRERGANGEKEERHLRIGYLSAKLFTTLLNTPSAEHALLLGCDTEGWFQVSSRHLFINVFSRDQEAVYDGTTLSAKAQDAGRSTLQKLRMRPLLSQVSSSTPLSGAEEKLVPHSRKHGVPIPVPPRHYLDRLASGETNFSWFGVLDYLYIFEAANFIVISAQFKLDALERKVFGLVRARLVRGQEPWMAWEKAARVYWGEGLGVNSGVVGSV